MGKKTDDKILDLLKKRVIERDNELITKEYHSATKEALTELTSLSAAEVEVIYNQAKKEVLQKEKEKRKKLLYIGAALAVILLFFWPKISEHLRKPTVFIDNFDRNNNHWNFSDKMTNSHFLENGTFIIDAYREKLKIEYINHQVNFPKNYSIEADLKQLSGEENNFGFYLGKDNVSFAYFFINTNGMYKIGASVDGKWKPNLIQKESKHIKRTKGSVNSIKVDVKGNNYEFFINGNSVEKGELYNIKMLQYSFAVGGTQKISFDNLKIINSDSKAIIYSNSFDKASEPWGNKYNVLTKSTFQNGGYVLESNTDKICNWAESWFPKDFKKMKAYKVDIDATILSMEENAIFGFMWIINNKENISFEVRNGKEGRINVRRFDQSTYTGNFGAAEPAKKDKIKLSIQKDSEGFEFYLNGVLVDKIGNEQLGLKKIEKMGLSVCSGIKVSFDNLEFKEIKE